MKDQILISEEAIHARVQQLGAQISHDYQGKDLLLLGILKGAIPFIADIAHAISLPLEVDYMMISSYGNETYSSGDVRIVKDFETSVEQKHVLIVEDIIDSGLTAHFLINTARSRNPLSIRLCSLLNKECKKTHHINIDYIGFNIPDKFVIGYGMDYKQRYRNLPFIGVIDGRTDLERKSM